MTIASLLPAFRTLNTTVHYRIVTKDAPRGLFALGEIEEGRLLVQITKPVNAESLFHVTVIGKPMNRNVKNLAGVNFLLKLHVQFQ